MKRTVVLYMLACFIPVVLFFEMFQAYRYNRLEQEVLQKVQEQYEIIEDNKRAISAISVMTVPGRIETIAKTELNMRRAKPEEIIRIKINNEGEGK